MSTAKPDPSGPSALLTVSDLGVVLGEKEILKGVSFDVRPGETLALLGGSGTGKSVTLKTILGLLPASAGSVDLGGVELLTASARDAAAARARVGMLFQGGALFDSLSIWENISFRLRHAEGSSRSDARARADALLEAVGLDLSMADRRPADLSGGQQKRAGLARALAAEPEILFFDEPTTGLDPISAGRIDNLMAETIQRTGAAGVMITHDIASVRKVCQRVAFLWDGAIGWTGRVDDLDTSDFEPLKTFLAGRD
jgi:phospholipid/cholesterol/gamma-HCH transport system ATP-binding protein